jgi:hypothetical protein
MKLKIRLLALWRWLFPAVPEFKRIDPKSLTDEQFERLFWRAIK